MKDLTIFLSFLFICTLFVCGCDLAQPKNKRQSQPDTQQANEPQQQDTPQVADLAEGSAQPTTPQDNQTVQEYDITKAQVGDAARGRSLTQTATGERATEIITAPLTAMFRTQQRIVLQQIEGGKNFFRGEHGRLPNSHEEFMEKIIAANNIKLPQLPPNEEYFYDAADGELKVKRPK